MKSFILGLAVVIMSPVLLPVGIIGGFVYMIWVIGESIRTEIEDKP